MSYYFLDLNAKPSELEVYRFDDDNLQDLMDEADVTDPMALNDLGDHHVFNDETKADKFLARYLFEYRALPKRPQYPDTPHILLKRRYLVMIQMGLKNHTYRGYQKPWKVGQLFTFHDQVHYVTCKLTKPITENEDGDYRYDFVKA